VEFYTNVIGLNLLGEFKDHSGYNGVFIGEESKDWHLEFTQTKEKVDHHFDDDDLLVFYPGDQNEYDQLLLRIRERNLVILTPKNPYWKENGITVNDPDGYKVVISPMKIR
jgi:hypothetical protein